MTAQAQQQPATHMHSDGRTARSRRTRASIAEAMLALIEVGNLRPTAPAIAERASVSLRSVFQHFDDLESLYAEAAEMQFRRVSAAARPVSGGGALSSRVEAFTAERARLLEAVSPVRRAALLVEPFSAEVAARLRVARHAEMADAARVFEAELRDRAPADRRELLHAITAASGWPAWEALRAHQGLSRQLARQAMARTITALLRHEDSGAAR